MKKVLAYGLMVVAVGGLFFSWKTDRMGMAYEVKDAHYMESPCGEGKYSEKGKYFDMVGDVVVSPFELHKCGK